ncbi:MAG: hypothetical protein KF879_06745 [Saprospiraceae bacterium]|nr:hypothetical protein [Saprospiraceae bacterium]
MKLLQTKYVAANRCSKSLWSRKELSFCGRGEKTSQTTCYTALRDKTLLPALPSVKNNHVYLSVDKHYQCAFNISAVKCDIPVRWSIYISSGNQIAVHPRDYRPSKYTAEQSTYVRSTRYLDRSPQYYINRASKHSGHLKETDTRHVLKVMSIPRYCIDPVKACFI